MCFILLTLGFVRLTERKVIERREEKKKGFSEAGGASGFLAIFSYCMKKKPFLSHISPKIDFLILNRWLSTFCSSSSPHLSELMINLMPPIELSHGWTKWHLSNKYSPFQSHQSVPSQPNSPTKHKRKEALLIIDSTSPCHLPIHLRQKYSGHSFMVTCLSAI